MEVIWAIVPRKGIGFAVERELPFGNPIGHPSDGLAEKGAVVRCVQLLGGEVLDDVLLADEERLDDGSEGEELERCWSGHG